MANPNIVNVASIYGTTTYLTPANTAAQVLLSNAASSGFLYKINQFFAYVCFLRHLIFYLVIIFYVG